MSDAADRLEIAYAHLAAMTRERDALAELLSGFIPSQTTDAIGWKHAPETAQNAVTWAVECAAHALRQELAHAPEHTQNRMTATIYFGEERWTLTLARGDFEHRVEAQRDEAREGVRVLSAALDEAREQVNHVERERRIGLDALASQRDALLDELARLVRALYLDDKPRVAAIARAAQVVIDHGRGDAEIEALARMRP